ncbi:winged helix-turn-helix transcriptional regulator [Roseinatronobacter alkalisoli]|uniref:Helix-turn-helix domain-containing protein n=1 Tax=Roseinatronobacter alkalisoli TaxID=3028235 RepID=A0ABT5TCG9_9RHOB|nr:helix-turn-helix domain-containing protein [Roseinatronobacter sp. HJB301]MDD7972821.1 helix-turn-helix domain-containing protein [Roseinatronobacter sp. HJB301]
MPDLDPLCFSSDCPSRSLFDQIADKWSMMVLAVLDDGPQRFNAIRRRLEGVSQKALTQCLRRLERNGLVSRQVISLSPVAVQYQITPLGRSLQQPFRELHNWTVDMLPEVQAARQMFDGASAGPNAVTAGPVPDRPPLRRGRGNASG